MIKFCQTCKEQPAIPRGKYCQEHRYKKKKICNFDINPKCEKKARGQGEKPGYCVEHGGGKKCFELDCKNTTIYIESTPAHEHFKFQIQCKTYLIL